MRSTEFPTTSFWPQSSVIITKYPSKMKYDFNFLNPINPRPQEKPQLFFNSDPTLA